MGVYILAGTLFVVTPIWLRKPPKGHCATILTTYDYQTSCRQAYNPHHHTPIRLSRWPLSRKRRQGLQGPRPEARSEGKTAYCLFDTALGQGKKRYPVCEHGNRTAIGIKSSSSHVFQESVAKKARCACAKRGNNTSNLGFLPTTRPLPPPTWLVSSRSHPAPPDQKNLPLPLPMPGVSETTSVSSALSPSRSVTTVGAGRSRASNLFPLTLARTY